MSSPLKILNNVEATNQTSNVKKINNLLNSSKTRGLGLNLLKSSLPQCTDEEVTEWCVSWMQSCCKVDDFTKKNTFSITLLNDLLKISANYTELKKSVSFFITARFYDYFSKYLSKSPGGWSCVETCFLLYRGACGQFQEPITKRLNNRIEKNEKISSTVANCYALLPSLGGGGNDEINYKTNWKSQFLKLINICHSILNDLFVDVKELQEYDSAGETYKKTNDHISINHLAVKLHNYCSVLSFMLVNKYPTVKCIQPDVILQMICRGLAVNSTTMGINVTTNIIALQKVLPDIHIALHSLLNALIVTCGSQLLPYSNLICKLVKQTLEWTDCTSIYGSEKPYGSLRTSAYETLCNWLVKTRSGSCVETIAKTVISNAVNDIHSQKAVTLLKDSKEKNTNSKEQTRRRIDASANSCLCYSALKALQYLFKFLGNLIKMEEHKYLQEVVVKLLMDIQNSSQSNVQVPYSISTCRKELYGVLLELVNQPCLTWPPPTCLALRIFSQGQNDTSCDVSQFCSTAIILITNILHSQFDNGYVSTTSENREERERQMDWRSEPSETENNQMIVDKVVEDEAITVNGIENEKDLSPVINTKNLTIGSNKDDEQSYESDASTSEDSINTVPYTKNDNCDKDIQNVSTEEKEVNECEEIKETSQEDEEADKEASKEKEETVKEASKEDREIIQEEEPVIKKRKSVNEENVLNGNLKENIKEKTPSPKKTPDSASLSKLDELHIELTDINKTPSIMTRNRSKSSEASEDSHSSKSSPNTEVSKLLSPSDEDKMRDPRKRYFLRSKTSKASSEELEDSSKDNGSPEPSKTLTPVKSTMRSTPSIINSKKRPRTRASTKPESLENIAESNSLKKDVHDEDEDILDSFNDSIVD